MPGDLAPTGAAVPTVDVVIVTRDRPHLVEAAVRSVLASDHTALRLWVMDQSADDTTRTLVEAIAGDDDRVRHVALDSVGSSRSRNAGLARCTSDVVLFTDDDCTVDPGWIGAVLAEFGRSGPAAVFGAVDPTTVQAPDDAAVAPWLSVAAADGDERREFVGDPTDLGFGHGANMAVDRRVVEELGGFDPLLGAGGPLRSWPERDLGHRLLVAGHLIVFQPAARVSHEQWRTWDEVFAVHRNYGFGAGAAIGKYVRCRERAAVRLLWNWFVQLGVRQIVSGVVRWRDPRKVRLGLIHVRGLAGGLWASRRHAVDHDRVLYLDPDLHPDLDPNAS